MSENVNLLIVEPATAGLELLQNANSMGYNIFVLTANKDERVIQERYKKFIFKLIEVDTNCSHQISRVAVELHQQYKFSAVIPGFELYVAEAARLAKLINVPGLPLESAEALRDKNLMRLVLKKAGLKTPKHSLLNSLQELEKIAHSIKFPCVIKPIDQSGSLHVSKVNNLAELKNAYNAMCNETWTEMGKGVGQIAVVEEYIDGPEFSVEGFVNQSIISFVSITEKLIKGSPFFVEMGHLVHSKLETSTKGEIFKYMRKVIKAFNINLGVFHAELKLSKQGPVLIEISGRLAGDRICDLILLSSDINLYKIMIESHLQKKIKYIQPQVRQYAGIRYFSTHLSEYSTITGIDKLCALPGCQDFKLLIKPKSFIPPLTNFSARVGYFIFTANSYEELKSILDYAETLIRIL